MILANIQNDERLNAFLIYNIFEWDDPSALFGNLPIFFLNILHVLKHYMLFEPCIQLNALVLLKNYETFLIKYSGLHCVSVIKFLLFTLNTGVRYFL